MNNIKSVLTHHDAEEIEKIEQIEEELGVVIHFRHPKHAKVISEKDLHKFSPSKKNTWKKHKGKQWQHKEEDVI